MKNVPWLITALAVGISAYVLIATNTNTQNLAEPIIVKTNEFVDGNTNRPYADFLLVKEDGSAEFIGESFTLQNGKILECEPGEDFPCVKHRSLDGSIQVQESDGGALTQIEYYQAELSPNGEWVAVRFSQWEDPADSIGLYNIAADEITYAGSLTKGSIEWTDDSLLRVLDTCTASTDGPLKVTCEDRPQISASENEPWVLKAE